MCGGKCIWTTVGKKQNLYGKKKNVICGQLDIY